VASLLARREKHFVTAETFELKNMGHMQRDL
jgi:hypothetical protein